MTGKIFNKQRSLIGSLGVGLGIALLIEIVGALLCAVLINKEALPQTSIGIVAVVVHGVSAAVGGTVAGVKNGGQIVFACGGVGLALGAIWLGIGILCFNGIGEAVLGNLAGICAGVMAACGLQLLPKRSAMKRFSGYSR